METRILSYWNNSLWKERKFLVTEGDVREFVRDLNRVGVNYNEIAKAINEWKYNVYSWIDGKIHAESITSRVRYLVHKIVYTSEKESEDSNSDNEMYEESQEKERLDLLLESFKVELVKNK